MEDYDWLILQTLYKHKNITRTSQELFTSQPSITKRLHKMEAEFSITIVKRGRRGIHFTPQGEFLAKSADYVLSNLRAIKERVQNMDAQVSGTLRIGISNYSTKQKLPGILKNFKLKNPNVEFQVIPGSSREIYDLIYCREVHVGFLRGNYNWSGGSHLLFEEPLCVASVEKVNLEDLPELPRITYHTEQGVKTILDNWWMENYSRPPHVGIKVDNVDTCREMIVNGLGYAILPRLMLEHDKQVKKINIRDKQGEQILRQTWMYYHNETLELNTVSAFVNFIKKLNLE
ncbi:LysR family transcriptional regulator [Oceanobacillus sojae]|uniref:LysR family transcriptional regulator n=1 Tax=Oceanobacillus sojae TaxID=582851 RepID=UPI0009888D66|nr:LysR family transcriptional regulator [Oceanobacillus sojae]MCT1903866.1 LysR family transcriptional regulator [Oceanobacillus sojae]